MDWKRPHMTDRPEGFSFGRCLEIKSGLQIPRITGERRAGQGSDQIQARKQERNQLFVPVREQREKKYFFTCSEAIGGAARSEEPKRLKVINHATILFTSINHGTNENYSERSEVSYFILFD